MSERFTEFLIDRTGSSPRNLGDSIRRVQNCSAGFRESWNLGNQHDAFQTSQEAFEHLDYIQNEILRQRDVRRNNSSWSTSPFNSALNISVGTFLLDISTAEKNWFTSLNDGDGAMPSGSNPTVLSLGTALNKLKHRSTSVFNFSLPASGGHLLHVFTVAGMGQPDALSEINLQSFCSACKTAASLI